MNIVQELKKHRHFNNSEITIANYVLQNKDKVLDMSIQELAKATYTSTSTIVRLCRKIGLKGYQQFKITLSANLQDKFEEIASVNADFPFTNQDSNLDISKKILELSRESMESTYQLLSNEALANTVQMILQGKRVAIFASGDTYIDALAFQNDLMKIHLNMLMSTIPSEDLQLALTLDKNDCAIIISYSGENKNLVRLIKILKSSASKIIAISAKRDSSIAKLSDIVLPIFKKEDPSIKFSTFSSQVAIKYVLSVLFSCIFASNFEENSRQRIKTETILLDTRFR
ncbi:MAG: MurR/RpiR family transcriptional regulator [Oenococcus sp.]|uniref:MurR/RpiR family transcriptional regulator n=1 Tax=Oenococcus TaxID=46254 RepID=UPI0021E7575A|nr:MurR/RpiR family transcriptional regulator [Oenococcus kitaharae]MCV3296381.1 MurR/RpiR family transcriptional regulator [Oenococcus kitaharae]